MTTQQDTDRRLNEHGMYYGKDPLSLSETAFAWIAGATAGGFMFALIYMIAGVVAEVIS